MATKEIDARPTKNFFISMLVRDISLKDSIGDLVDNSIDGAKRLRGNSSYDGLFIKIEITDQTFLIEDNCGGIDLKTAEDYAFRFGRPDDVEKTEFSIGQFGIGMKRALFKMGNSFTVSSQTVDNSFSMNVDANEWRKDLDKWTFNFDKSETFSSKKPVSESGTKILVNDLQEDVKSAFNDTLFLQELKNELELDHLYNINKGIKIVFNGSRLKSKKLSLQVSDLIKLGQWNHIFSNGVKVKLIVGLGEPNEQLGGWYVFCNERLIVGPDRTRLTGWTGRKGDGVANYHNQYWRFRGFAFFEAEDASFLPWNTTKTGMNTDSPVYKAVRAKMIEMMKSVINGFLNYLKKENESSYAGDQILHEALESTEIVNISDSDQLKTYVSNDRTFTYPEPDRSGKKVDSGETRIAYTMDKEKVAALKKFFSVTNNPDVGRRSFEYVYENEIED